MNYYSNHAGSLEGIRLQLRGPIAASPFAGINKPSKLNYCERQARLYTKWFNQTGNKTFQLRAVDWLRKKKDVLANRL